MKAKMALVVAAAVLPITLVSLIGVDSAAAATTATGTVNCTTVQGKVVFKPALKQPGTPSVTNEVATIKVTATGCTASGSNRTVTKAVVKGTITTLGAGANSCTGLFTSKPVSFTAKWKPRGTAPSVVAFSGYNVQIGTTVGFVLPNTGGTASVAGSFPGSDGGKASSASAFTTMSQNALLTKCATKTGVPSVVIGSGAFKLS